MNEEQIHPDHGIVKIQYFQKHGNNTTEQAGPFAYSLDQKAAPARTRPVSHPTSKSFTDCLAMAAPAPSSASAPAAPVATPAPVATAAPVPTPAPPAPVAKAAPAPASATAATAASVAPAKTSGEEVDRFDGAVDFLANIAGNGPVALAAIVPDGALTGRTFNTTKERTELRAWLQGRNGHANLYFSLNEPKPESECEGKAGKLLERDVARIRGITVDLDPEGSDYNSERKRLLSLAQEWPDHFLAPATAAIDSGNGVQLIWLFPTPLLATAENIAAVKAQALGMNKMLGSDAVQSVDHLFRVPARSTFRTKRSVEMVERATEARLLRFDPATACALKTLAIVADPVFEDPKAAAVELGDFDSGAVIAAAEGEPLPAHLAAPVAEMMRTVQGFETAIANTNRSDRDFALAACCIEYGLKDATEIGQVAFSLSPEKLLEKDAQGRGAAYAVRTISAALAKTKPKGRVEDWFPATAMPGPGPTAPATAAPAAAAERRLTLVPLTGEGAHVGPIDDLPEICALLARGEVTLAFGPPGIGKSLFVLKLALALAADRPALVGEKAFEASQLGDVIFVSNEDDVRVVQQRVEAERLAANLSDADFTRRQVHVLADRNFKVARCDRDGRVALTEGLASLARNIADIRASERDVCTVVLDTLNTVFDGVPENDNNAMGAATAALAEWAKTNHVAIVLLHHQNKAADGRSGNGGGKLATARGASATGGAVRRSFSVTDLEQQEAAGLNPELAQNAFVVKWAKGSYGPKWPPRYFEKRGFPVRVRKADGAEYDRSVVAAVQFTPTTSAAADSRQQIEDQAIAAFANDLMDGDDKVKLPDIRDALGARMREAGICKLTDRYRLDARITAALGAGVEVERDGQIVCVKIERVGRGVTATRYVTRTLCNTFDIQSREVA